MASPRAKALGEQVQMNEESRARANVLLASITTRGQGDRVWFGSVVALGAELGFESPIETARAVRALVTRGRIAALDGGYEILDARPIFAGERTAPDHRTPAARARTRVSELPDTVRVDATTVGPAEISASSLIGEVQQLREEIRHLREAIRNLQTGLVAPTGDTSPLR